MLFQSTLVRNHFWRAQENIRDVTIATLPSVKQNLWGTYTAPMFWWEIGGCVIHTPRQYGKTTWLNKTAEAYPPNDRVILTHRESKISNWSGKRESECHLFIDEPWLIEKDRLNLVLNRDWASVTMVGTFFPR